VFFTTQRLPISLTNLGLLAIVDKEVIKSILVSWLASGDNTTRGRVGNEAKSFSGWSELNQNNLTISK